MNKLQFKKVIENENLVAKTTYEYIDKLYTEEEKQHFLVAQINPKYMDGIKLCEHYNIDLKMGVNCLICECTRAQHKEYVALLVPTGYKYNMSSTVRKYTNSRMDGIW